MLPLLLLFQVSSCIHIIMLHDLLACLIQFAVPLYLTLILLLIHLTQIHNSVASEPCEQLSVVMSWTVRSPSPDDCDCDCVILLTLSRERERNIVQHPYGLQYIHTNHK